jgi:hypothetical protein
LEFFSVKHKKKVTVPDNEIKKKIYEVKGRGGNMMTRYAVVAETMVGADKVKLTKFVSKETFDSLTAPMA